MTIRRPSTLPRAMYHIELLFVHFYSPRGVLERLGVGIKGWLDPFLRGS